MRSARPFLGSELGGVPAHPGSGEAGELTGLELPGPQPCPAPTCVCVCVSGKPLAMVRSPPAFLQQPQGQGGTPAVNLNLGTPFGLPGRVPVPSSEYGTQQPHGNNQAPSRGLGTHLGSRAVVGRPVRLGLWPLVEELWLHEATEGPADKHGPLHCLCGP